MSRDIELQALNSEITNFLEDIAELIKEISQDSSSVLMMKERRQLELARDRYNNLRSGTNSVFEEMQVSKRILLAFQSYYLTPGVERTDALGFLRRIETECDKARVILEGLQKRVVLTSDKQKELETVKDEIAKMIEPVAPLYAHDLQQSLAEFSEGHLLASVLTAGRTIDVLMDKVEKASAQKTTEAQLDYLKVRGILDEKTEGYIVKAVKNYRNVYSHTVGSSPEIEDCLIVVLGTSKLLKNIIKGGLHTELQL